MPVCASALAFHWWMGFSWLPGHSSLLAVNICCCIFAVVFITEQGLLGEARHETACCCFLAAFPWRGGGGGGYETFSELKLGLLLFQVHSVAPFELHTCSRFCWMLRWGSVSLSFSGLAQWWAMLYILHSVPLPTPPAPSLPLCGRILVNTYMYYTHCGKRESGQDQSVCPSLW